MPFSTPFPPVALALHHADLGAVKGEMRCASLADVELWTRQWKPGLDAAQRPDGSWPWELHIGRAATTDGWLSLAIRRGSELDGLMSLGRGESHIAPGAGLIYIEYVGIAPTHLPPPIGRRCIAGIGSLLVITAMKIAQEVGCEGRVGLHSKVDVEDFYRKRGFEDLGYEITDDGIWRYFEIGPEAATLQLSRLGGSR